MTIYNGFRPISGDTFQRHPVGSDDSVSVSFKLPNSISMEFLWLFSKIKKRPLILLMDPLAVTLSIFGARLLLWPT